MLLAKPGETAPYIDEFFMLFLRYAFKIYSRAVSSILGGANRFLLYVF
jgi:hypothetical protein